MKYLKRLFIIIIALCFMFLASCGENKPSEEIKPTYNITFDLNGGKFESEVSLTYQDGNDYVLPIPTKKGYDFTGWKEILEDNTLSTYEVTFLNNRDYHLKATWEKVYKADELNDLYTISKRTFKDVVYKTVLNKELKMDIYLPAMKQGEKYPVLFFFFGGGWFMGDKSYISYYNAVLKDLNGEGFIVVAPNYRLVNATDDTHYPLPVEDCFDAIRYVVKYQNELHADINNMGSFGHSAGGYFSLMAAFAQDHYKGDEALKDYNFKLKYAIALAAPSVYDEDSLSQITSMGLSMLSGYFGTTDLYSEDLSSAFPNYYIEENNPKLYLVHGMADELVPLSQSELFYELAIAEGIDVTIEKIEHANHTFDAETGYESSVSVDYSACSKRIRDFIISQK